MIFALTVFLIAAGYVFLIAPSMKRRDISPLTDRPVAHRGAHSDEKAENCIGAFKSALCLGYPIELDVRLSADSVPMVIHDDSLFRLCRDERCVSNLTAEELSELCIGEKCERIPTLSQVLDEIDGQVPLLIELKGKASCGIAERTSEILESYKGYYAIESFDPCCLYRYRRIDSRIPLGILARSLSGADRSAERLFWIFSGRVMFNFLCRPDFIAYRFSDRLPLSVRVASALGAPILGWTAQNHEEYLTARESFDGVICDNIAEIADKTTAQGGT